MAEPNLNQDWEPYKDSADTRMLRATEPIDYSLPLKVFALPGCTACLRTKEFLTKHGVPFIAVNPQKDPKAFEELAALGVRRVPIAMRGKHWADGQVLSDLARIAGIALQSQAKLSPKELAQRATRVMSVAVALAARIPAADLNLTLPERPRSYKQLACHIFQIYELFLELAEDGKRLEFVAFFRDSPPGVVTSADVARFGSDMLKRFVAWWEPVGKTADFSATADVYYGDQTLQTMHEFLERTVWHSAQHTRQLQTIVRNLGVAVDDCLTPADLEGLPLPDQVYDSEVKLD